MKYLEIPFEDIKMLEDFFGDKTINQIRSDAGLTNVVGGEKSYVTWLKENTNVIKPVLKLISNPFLEETKKCQKCGRSHYNKAVYCSTKCFVLANEEEQL